MAPFPQLPGRERERGPGAPCTARPLPGRLGRSCLSKTGLFSERDFFQVTRGGGGRACLDRCPRAQAGEGTVFRHPSKPLCPIGKRCPAEALTGFWPGEVFPGWAGLWLLPPLPSFGSEGELPGQAAQGCCFEIVWATEPLARGRGAEAPPSPPPGIGKISPSRLAMILHLETPRPFLPSGRTASAAAPARPVGPAEAGGWGGERGFSQGRGDGSAAPSGTEAGCLLRCAEGEQ